MAILSANGKMSIHKGKTTDQGRAALYRLLEKSDKIAFEANFGEKAKIYAIYTHEEANIQLICAVRGKE
ncbi:MAG: hypothetical protein FWC97_10955 [Treponema sp.]|nr:hypothetical protein [Treponema sp.]